MLQRHHLTFVGLFLVTACTTPRDRTVTSVEPSSDTCYACHGTPSNGNAAPPGVSWKRNPSPDAHQSHLVGNERHAAFPCETCHKQVTSVEMAGHITADQRAPLQFSALATKNGTLTPVYDRDWLTCTNTYCHGVTLDGGTLTAPAWTDVGGGTVTGPSRCGSCHGLPPTGAHPNNPNCYQCHGGVIDSDRHFLDPSKHLDGTVELNNTACDTCHGSGGNPAPPKDLSGETATTAVGVGAHRKHLASSTWHKAVPCSECHLVPTNVEDAGHLGAAPAPLTFGAVALADGAAGTFDTDTATCNVYCHGPTLLDGGGANSEPVWTEVTASEPLWANNGTGAFACDSCHGAPPAGRHPPRTDCWVCHTEVVDQNHVIIAPDKHIDGTVQRSTEACNSCHGDSSGNTTGPAAFAPPLDTHGGSARTGMGVGAHQQHLAASSSHAAIPCTTCHVVPTTPTDPGHNNGTVDLAFAGVAVADGASASFSAGTCANYCHGATLGGGSHTTPVWNLDATASANEAACGTCHGTPPPSPHVPRSDCGTCHPSGATHVNGTVDLKTLQCNTCHGNAAGDPADASTWAPPLDLAGNSDTTVASVGAHAAHVTASAGFPAIACAACHVVPATLFSPGHMNGTTDVVFGAQAIAGGATASYDRTAHTCTNWCHGAKLPSGSHTTPVWTKVGQNEAACGTCHGTPPAAPHPPRSDCSSCHPVGAATHVNGVVDLKALQCNSCHGDPSGNPASPLAWAPPVDAEGNASSAAVGVHQAHLAGTVQTVAGNDGTWHRAVQCNDCHKVPASYSDPGHLGAAPAPLTWGVVAQINGATPSYDAGTRTCSDVYCHGNHLFDGSTGSVDTTPAWTDPATDFAATPCGTLCHSTPPGGSHPAAATLLQCAQCHGSVWDGTKFVNPSLHINGLVNYN